MTTFVSDFEPQPLWRHFDQILTIPRASKDEGKMRDYVIAVAEKNGLEHRADAAGNVVVYKPGTSGHEEAPAVVLQAHLDMVQQKNSDVEFDFDNDPIEPRRDGDYLKATGTTLGADNGIGVASMMAVMEAKDIPHGPLEFLFTVDEETGLTGAKGLKPGFLKADIMLNLDSEEDGALYVGCAGGMDTAGVIKLNMSDAPADTVAIEINMGGLKGGHSGLDVATGRQILGQLRATTVDGERSVFLVTHNSEIAKMADRVIRLRDGEIVDNTENPSPAPVAELNW